MFSSENTAIIFFENAAIFLPTFVSSAPLLVDDYLILIDRQSEQFVGIDFNSRQISVNSRNQITVIFNFGIFSYNLKHETEAHELCTQ